MESETVQQIAQKIAYAMKCAAGFSIKDDNPEWCELVFATFPNDFGESIEVVHIGAMPARVKIRGEIVRLYLYLNNLVSLTVMRDAIRVALDPFVVGGRQFVVHDGFEGLEVLLIEDHREVHVIHDASSTAEIALPSA